MVRHLSLLCVCFVAANLPSGVLPAAETAAQRYAALVGADRDLVGWWQFDDDLKDSKGKADAQPQGGPAQFTEGPGGGRALDLADGRFVTMGPTPGLDLKPASVEFWFKPTFAPGSVRYNPCIVAKRGDGDHHQTRFSVHIWGDYASLAVWNGKGVLRCFVGDGPLKRNQWYHVAVVSGDGPMQVYVNGVECTYEGPQGTFSFENAKLPLCVGASQPKGAELLATAIDELAFYRRVLSEQEIAAHVDAMGFQPQRARLAEARAARIKQEQDRLADLQARRDKIRQQMLDDPALTAPGRPYVFREEHLEAISLPLGGIGAGSVQINGHGELAIWQIFNNFQGVRVPDSFLAVRAVGADGKPVLRALQTVPVGPFAAMKSLTFRGAYPFGWFQFDDAALPVKVSLEAFNPLIPLDARNSAIPCIVFNVTVANPTDQPVDVSVLASQQNAVGCLGDEAIRGRKYRNYGGNKTQVVRQEDATLLAMSSGDPPQSPGFGTMTLALLDEGATATAYYASLEKLAEDFGDGQLTEVLAAGPSPKEETLDGALALSIRLAPGEKRTVPILLTWHFPAGRHGAGEWSGQGNMYANWWPNAVAVERYVAENLDSLSEKTRLYHETLFDSNLPCWLLERIGSQVAVLRSQTCFWTADGYFGGWEGCCRKQGCCHGNCNHVWHYAQAHARLFPEIARQMRKQEYTYEGEDGAIPHRQPKSHPAFDGQCGAVLNSYREYCMSADQKWLDANWPSIKRAMDYLIARWDADRDGVLAGPQWNTLDGALGGSSSWLGSLYLAALAAAEKMALLENDGQSAQEYAAIRAAGSKNQNDTLFNGEYYYQIVGPEPHEDYGTGCEIDQVLGQWWAHQLDLGWLYPEDRVRTALGSLFRYNFRGNLEGLPQLPRKFVADYDPGMQMITWPKGPRPAKVIRYGDEVMTGFEYSAAAAMIQAGLLREGLCVARADWIRYDGRLRTELSGSDYASWGYSGNPFGDDECGKFYARAMSVWSMLLACQGCVYEGPAARIGFCPVWQPEDHRSMFTAAEGWGTFTQRRTATAQTERIELRYGKLRVGSLLFQLAEGKKPKDVTVTLASKSVPAKIRDDGDRVRIDLAEPVTVEAPQALEIELTY